VPIDQRPATGRSVLVRHGVLVRHKKSLMAMTASLALLAGLASSAEAFPFDWPFNPYPQPNVTRHRATPVARPARSAVAKPEAAEEVREKPAAKEKDKSATKETPADVAAKAKGVLTIAISLNKQQLTLYSDGMPIARSHVSTGTPGHQTPTGVFSIIQKDRWHHSNLYGDAPMYFMQRITWSGVAMHQGITPPNPASHGCIRLPEAFARQLWGITKLGVRVIITHGEVTPAAISNGHLFTRRLEPLEAKRETIESSAKVVESAYNALGAAGRKREPATKASKSGDTALDAMAYAVVNQHEPATSSEVVRSAYDNFDLSNARRTKSVPAGTGVAEVRPLKPGPISVFISRAEGKLFVRKGFEPIFSAPVTFEQPDRPLGTHVFTALALNDDDTMRWNVVTVPTGWTKPSGKSKNAEPATVGRPSTAAEALERVSIPQEAADRISELMSAGASLIISDQGLGPETGTGTDFIVLTR
jgi:lipoprotein-anchoring transpeptidase ErfK/SrfK